jgi:two-component system OmpR family response regulator
MSEAAHVLVVDDDREIRGLLRDYLEKNGFKATAVGGAPEVRRRTALMRPTSSRGLNGLTT